MSDKISNEKKVVRRMIELYCRKNHASDGLCPGCMALFYYASDRLDRCPKGNAKGSCRKCSIHCYAPIQKEQIRKVMRFSGPRMILYHPVSAINHLFCEMLKS